MPELPPFWTKDEISDVPMYEWDVLSQIMTWFSVGFYIWVIIGTFERNVKSRDGIYSKCCVYWLNCTI